MGTLDVFVVVYSSIYIIYFIVFLLYQFDIIDVSETLMIWWTRFLNVVETVILISIRFFELGNKGIIALAIFYILNVVLLVLQFIFSEFGIGRKILDIFWIGFYVILFLIDICNINITQIIQSVSSIEGLADIDSFLKDSFIGKAIIAIVAPVIRTLILEAIHKNE